MCPLLWGQLGVDLCWHTEGGRMSGYVGLGMCRPQTGSTVAIYWACCKVNSAGAPGGDGEARALHLLWIMTVDCCEWRLLLSYITKSHSIFGAILNREGLELNIFSLVSNGLCEYSRGNTSVGLRDLNYQPCKRSLGFELITSFTEPHGYKPPVERDSELH